FVCQAEDGIGVWSVTGVHTCALPISLLVLGLADTTLDYLGNRLFLTVGQRIVLAIRCDMFAHLLALPPAFHQRRRAGELMSRLGPGLPRVAEVGSILGPTPFPHAVTVVR